VPILCKHEWVGECSAPDCIVCSAWQQNGQGYCNSEGKHGLVECCGCNGRLNGSENSNTSIHGVGLAALACVPCCKGNKSSIPDSWAQSHDWVLDGCGQAVSLLLCFPIPLMIKPVLDPGWLQIATCTCCGHAQPKLPAVRDEITSCSAGV